MWVATSRPRSQIGAPFNQAQRSRRRRKSTFFGAVFKVGRYSLMVGYFCLNYLPLKSFETGCPMLCCFILVVSCLARTTARVASLHYGALQWHAAPCRMPNEACDHILCVSIREAHGHLPSSIFHKCWTFSSSLFTKPHRINTWGAWKGVRQRSRENRVASSPTSSQQKFRRFLCAKKTYPPKDSKRSEENGKNSFNFLGGSALVTIDSWPT